MADASIHFEAAKPGGFGHMMREQNRRSATYLLKDSKYQNEYWTLDKDGRDTAQELFDQEYAKLTGRGKRPKFENCLREAVINLDTKHTVEDVKNVCQKLEEKYGLICTSIAIHRDEGHKENGHNEYNIHAHCQFMTFTQTNDEVKPTEKWRKITNHDLSTMQDLVAETLGMKRGERGSERKHLDHKEYREYKRLEAERVKELKAEHKRELEELKQKLDAEHAQDKERALAALNAQHAEETKILKANLAQQVSEKSELEKAKNSAEKRVQSLKNENFKKDGKIAEQEQDKQTAQAELNEALKKHAEELKTLEADKNAELQKKDAEIAKLEKAANSDWSRANQLEKDLEYARELIGKQDSEIEKLKSENSENNAKIAKLERDKNNTVKSVRMGLAVQKSVFELEEYANPLGKFKEPENIYAQETFVSFADSLTSAKLTEKQVRTALDNNKKTFGGIDVKGFVDEINATQEFVDEENKKILQTSDYQARTFYDRWNATRDTLLKFKNAVIEQLAAFADRTDLKFEQVRGWCKSVVHFFNRETKLEEQRREQQRNSEQVIERRLGLGAQQRGQSQEHDRGMSR